MDDLLSSWNFFKDFLLNHIFFSFLIASVTGLLLRTICSLKTPRLNIPPGPKGLPLIGYLPVLQKSPHLHFAKLKEKFGPIIRMKVLHREIVVLNDYDSIKEAFMREEVLERPQYFIFSLVNIRSVSTINGIPWKDNRRFSLRVLRDLGFGKRSMENRIKDEVEALMEVLRQTEGRPTDFEETLVPSMSNNIYSLVFGKRLKYDHPDRQFLDTTLKTFIDRINVLSILSFVPLWVQRLLFLIIARNYTFIDSFMDYIRKKIQEHEETLDLNCPRDFMDGYLMEIAKGESSSFTKNYLVGNTITFFGAGSNTVRITVQWLLLTTTVYPELQRKIQEEIDATVGRERSPVWEDHLKMPFTLAVMWEMYRWRTIAPVGIPRYTSVNIKVGDYDIKAGTMILANFWAVHNDPSLWEEPENFNPDRFINADGTLKKKPEYLIPFSVGKRNCPGEILTNVEVFLYLTTVLQKFNVVPAEDKGVLLECQEKFLNLPVSKSLKFIPRMTY